MKLVKQSKRGFQYQMGDEEARSLRLLVKQFPVAPISRVKISKTDADAVEREKLLNESLAGHRDELKRKAGDLISDDNFKSAAKIQIFRVSLEGREIMLQILNHIRIECWRILGEPENLDMDVSSLPKDKIKYYHCMHLAGFFEYHFLNLEGEQ